MNPWTIDQGALIKITFDRELVGSVSGNESHFTISWDEYQYAPDGPIVHKTGEVFDTFIGQTVYDLILEMLPLERFYNAIGNITVHYDGGGTLVGNGGQVEEFSVSFNARDLLAKPHQHHSEHVEINSLNISGDLIHIYYSNAYSTEHVELNLNSISGTLTHVDDL